MLVQIKVLPLHCSNKININMKQLRLTEVERELIEAGRNYKRSYPNGATELRYYVEKLFTEWLDE